MSRICKTLLIDLLLTMLIFYPFRIARSQGAVVRAVLFYSPSCGHCHYVITEIIPPLFEKYGGQLQVIGVDVSQPDGQVLFLTTLKFFGLDQGGVPFLVVGDSYLVGSVDIPEKFPGMIEQYLALGGVGWPEIPGLSAALEGTNTMPESTTTPSPVVRSVLFTRSTCAHCQQIVEEVIPPLIERYGNQLQIFNIDVSLPEGDALFDAAIRQYQIKNIGVPTLVVDEHVMVGSIEIQQEFPKIIEDQLHNGGMDWPDLPGLQEMLASAPPTKTMPPAYTTPDVNGTRAYDSTPVTGLLLDDDGSDSLAAGFTLDPVGSSLATIIFLGMVAVVIYSIVFLRKPDLVKRAGLGWALPALCCLGIGVASYLAYVEITQTNAVCGPVGDCNTVQQSEYARLFGILPIGVLGIAGYVMIILAWLVMQSSKRAAWRASMALLAMTLFGTIFSIYLTFLELFVIRAICAWCLSSAVIMTLLMLISLRPAKATIDRWK
jgi:uncharacterized membrane protein